MSSPGDADDAGDLARYQNLSAATFFSSLGTALVIFGVQVIAFYILHLFLPRIYRPRTYLVPERERVKEPPRGWFKWLVPVFTTSNSEFIHKCGLDAFFFLRYLRLLLKIFIPAALVFLPILLPLNAVHGIGIDPALHATHTGLDTLSWGNIRPENTHRYWAHLILAVLLIIYVCFNFFGELQGYVRLRQAFLSSPQHRLRASATTVLVTGIPAKWLTYEALNELYDVFPGGIRNIWINRNFQPLSDKVDLRKSLAKKLESAETNLVQNAKKKQMEKAAKEAKKKKGKVDESHRESSVDGASEPPKVSVIRAGVSAGNPHQMQSIRDFIQQQSPRPDTRAESPSNRQSPQGMAREAVGAVGAGLGLVTGAVTKFGRRGFRGRLRQRGGDQDNSTLIENEPQRNDDDERGVQSFDGNASTVSGSRHGRQASDGADDLDQLDAVTQTNWKPWKKDNVRRPSPMPHTKDEEDSPFGGRNKVEAPSGGSSRQGSPHGSTSRRGSTHYPQVFDKEHDDQAGDENAVWKKYLGSGDRDSMRLPLFGQTWLPSMPTWTFIGKKVDTIYYCRKELARLNAEIETDQQDPEKYPLMNSAFIQFNNQVAAHMACQSLSHHLPQQMAPRLIEISPQDVIWDNMSIKWWERYIRTAVIAAILAGMIILWGFPVAFSGGLANVSTLEKEKGFHWLSSIPASALSYVQGVLPPAIISLLFIIVPPIMQLLASQSGVYTHNAVQIRVQNSYFFFLFIQLFLVVTVATGITRVISEVGSNVTKIPSLLANNLPGASTYFFSYMTLQALSTSAGALAQLGQLFIWFILGPVVDSTPRQKWHRQLKLPTFKWGKFFPVYTNLAVIGLVYSIIAPLILVFNIVTFGLFWVVYRHNTLYVNKFKLDTGGLLFPTAINQLFTGLYTMELCLVGLFFIVTDENGDLACKVQAIIMIVVFVLTAIYQWLLNSAFAPLFEYLPITLEDEAVMRDEDFAKAQKEHHRLLQEHHEEHVGRASETNSINNRGFQRPENEQVDTSNTSTAQSSKTSSPENIEMKQFEASHPTRSSSKGGKDIKKLVDLGTVRKALAPPAQPKRLLAQPGGGLALDIDPESQDMNGGGSKNPEEKLLFAGISDEIEDLTLEERDALVDRAFQHRALRARRPAIWIPSDDTGVSDDEIMRTKQLTDWIWISNEGAALDHKARCVYASNPPDFSEIDVIQL
ncbi:MAG: hypothetical protein M1828_006077 [Chrysothrix sp. TS-e1954]|nr:MAG: hypothetical protein M1828_006077 [Chrysothrix sp. TS-e1954]